MILRSLPVFAAAVFAAVVLLSHHASASDTAVPAFPFLGEVQTNNVNVRSGQSVDFDKIGQLYKGEKLAVFAEENGWYKILLPRARNYFITTQYVRPVSEDEGEVIGDRVNVRSGAGTEFPVITQVERGTMIRIIEAVDGWYRFESLADVYGWVAKEYVAFKSEDIGELQQGVIFTRSQEIAPGLAEQKELQKKVESKKVVTFTGVVQRQDLAEFKDARFKLVNEDVPACFLIGPETLIDDFLRYQVEVEGIVYEEESRNYPFPVVHVRKIQLVL